MTIFGRICSLLPLAGAMLLASCGGGGDSGTPSVTPQPIIQGIAVGEPSPNAARPDSTVFAAMARNAVCTDWRNKMVQIDQKYVYWDRAGNCPDNSYSQALYGATTDKLLCSKSDSIAGPRTVCADESARSLFEAILKDGDKDNLGLDKSHKVEPIAIPPKDGSAVTFTELTSEAFSSIHTPRAVVIRDAAAFAALWAEHSVGRTTAPPLPKVDFSRDMVLAAFAGDSSGCQEFGISRAIVNGDKIVVDLETRDINTVTVCMAVVTAPVSMVTVARSDAKVEFVNVTAQNLNFSDIDRSTRSLVQTADNRVVRDERAWIDLWTAHAGPDAKLPLVDFSKHMVVAVFLGTRPDGCHATDIVRVVRAGGKIKVDRVDWRPSEVMLCTASITTPAHLVKIDRSDEVVEFSSHLKTLQ